MKRCPATPRLWFLGRVTLNEWEKNHLIFVERIKFEGGKVDLLTALFKSIRDSHIELRFGIDNDNGRNYGDIHPQKFILATHGAMFNIEKEYFSQDFSFNIVEN